MLPQADAQRLELRDYVRVVRRRKLIIFLVAFVVVGSTLALSLVQTPIYAATAEVLLQQNSTESLFDPNTGQLREPQRAVQTEIRILTSQPVKAAAREELGYFGTVSARPAGQTDVIQVTGEDPKPTRAAALANTLARKYIDLRRRKAIDDVLDAAAEVQKKIVDLQAQIDRSTDGVRDQLIQQQALFRNKLDQLEVGASLKTGGAQLVSEAAVPTSPIRPRPLTNVLIALALGSILGVGLAFLVEHFDDTIKTKEDLEKEIAPLPCIATIPTLASWKATGRPHLVSLADPNSSASEAYRTLRTSIQFLGLDMPVRSLQVTSANAEEGKTTTLANLAVALARAGKRVVMVCSDLRRPRIHEFFGLNNDVGFTSVLLGETSLSEAMQKVPDVERLHLLASGPLPPNPSELLQSRRTEEIFARLQADGDFLLIDSPPVLPVTDALVLSKRVEGVMVVCSAHKTTHQEINATMDLLRQVEAPVLCGVLNGVRAEGVYSYNYYYYRSSRVTSNGNGRAEDSAHRRRPDGKKGSRT